LPANRRAKARNRLKSGLKKEGEKPPDPAAQQNPASIQQGSPLKQAGRKTEEAHARPTNQ